MFELKPTDYVRWAKGLKKCGYATNPKYAHLLIDLIERYDLDQYDEQGLALQADWEAFAAAEAAQATANEVLETVQNKDLNPARSASTIGRRSVQTSENYIRYILAEPGDTYDALAVELISMGWQLYRYNDIDRKKGTYTPRWRGHLPAAQAQPGPNTVVGNAPRRNHLGSLTAQRRQRQIPRSQKPPDPGVAKACKRKVVAPMAPHGRRQIAELGPYDSRPQQLNCPKRF